MATSKATPINQLQSPSNQNDNNLVNDILREIDQSGSPQPPSGGGGELSNEDIASRQAQYQMDPIAQSQQMMNEPDMSQQQMEQQQMMQQQMEHQMMQQQQQQQEPHIMGNPQMMSNMDTMYGSKPLTLFEKIINESKSPIIVATLCTLLCFKNVDTQLIKFIPKGLNSGGEITPVGLIAKGLIAGILFYLVKKFI